MKSKNLLISLVRGIGLKQLIIGVCIIGVDCFLYFNAAKNQPTLIGLGVIFAVGAIFVVLGLIKLLLPRTHSVFRDAAALGGPDEIDRYITEADERGETIFRGKTTLLTKKYFIGKGKQPHIFPTDSIMWAYTLITIKKENGVETSKTPSLKLAISGKSKIYNIEFWFDKEAAECMEAIQTSLPYVILGYSAERYKLFTKKNAEFEAEWRSYKEKLAQQ